ncbi:MAG: hypothetical protein AB8G77_17520 [Rhodothermales bacterium]
MTDLQRTARVAEIQSCLRNQPRLKLEFLAAMSKLFRDHNIDLPHDVLASLTLTLERAKRNKKEADEGKIIKPLVMAEQPTPAPVPHMDEFEEQPTPAPVPHMDEVEEQPTPAPVPHMDEVEEQPTPAPVPHMDEFEEQPTPAPVPHMDEFEEQPTPAPVPHMDEVEEQPTPAPVPHDAEGRESPKNLSSFIKKILPKGNR